ncbi:hypothetical protein [Microbacterium sp. BLY]|uniref:hypothetical protein n=1 Tax=Microbacterium sp. BLY TaxID=2823280 RepID=UPI001B337761|nr:hypothetical protein [Microbacterium sp. BLY]MBP3977853.1 hypothetical protein [Microbacterium sp. BLY]
MNWDSLRVFAQRCDAFGIAVPEPLARGLRLFDVAEAHAKIPGGRVLDLSDDELRERITHIAIRRHDGHDLRSLTGMTPGVSRVQDQLRAEVVRDTVPLLEEIIIGLQPHFDEAAAPLVDAAQRHGITYNTTSDFIVDQPAETIAAYRAAKKSWFAMEPIASFRILISRTFGLEPMGSSGVDFSVLFAEGESWGHNGRYYLEGKTTSHLDWFALASAGLRLNGIAVLHRKVQERRAVEFSQKAPAVAREIREAGESVFATDHGPQPPLPSYPR